MSKYVVDSKDLVDVADAIRTKGGTSASLEFPDGFVDAIEDISGGGSGKDHTFDIPQISGTYGYSGSSQEPTIVGYYSDFMTLSGDTTATDIGTHTIVVTLKDINNCQWRDGSTTPKNINWNILIGKVVPSIYDTDCIYNPDQDQRPLFSGRNYYTGQSFPSRGNRPDYTFSGNVYERFPGVYQITVAIKNSNLYEWSDGTTEPKTFTWTLHKATPHLEWNPYLWHIEISYKPTRTIDFKVYRIDGEFADAKSMELHSLFYDDYIDKLYTFKGDYVKDEGGYYFEGTISINDEIYMEIDHRPDRDVLYFTTSETENYLAFSLDDAVEYEEGHLELSIYP